MSAVLQFRRFRAYRPEPDSVRLGFDFSRWCCELYAADRLRRRISCESLDEARAEVARQEAAGLRRLPDATPDWTEVAYGSLSDGSLIDDGGDAA
jgi:hypothetical protein